MYKFKFEDCNSDCVMIAEFKEYQTLVKWIAQDIISNLQMLPLSIEYRGETLDLQKTLNEAKEINSPTSYKMPSTDLVFDDKTRSMVDAEPIA